MAQGSIALVSQALIKIGAAPIVSFEEGTTEATVANALYGTIRDALIATHPWRFATAQMRLPRLTAEPVADFAHSFQLPADFLRALSAGPETRGRGLHYRIAAGRLHANSDEVVLTYIFRPPESAYPVFFNLALVARLAAEFCIPITENTSRAEALYRLADNELRRAQLVDSQQASIEGIENFNLVEVRG